MDDDNLIDATFPPPSSRSGSRTPRKPKTKPPQDTLKQFWEQFNTKYPGKVYTVLPDNPYARSKAARTPKGTIQGQNAAKSYDQAKRECIRSVNRIVQECECVNQKYTDPHFDIEVDLKSGRRDYLDGLEEINLEMRPKGVKRVTVRNISFLSLVAYMYLWCLVIMKVPHVVGNIRETSILCQRPDCLRCTPGPRW